MRDYEGTQVRLPPPQMGAALGLKRRGPWFEMGRAVSKTTRFATPGPFRLL